MEKRIWTVAELLGAVNSLLKQGFAGLQVEGEITNANASARGHVYFSLKDSDAAIDCVMWAGKARALKFRPEDGLAVLATGSLTIYPQRGRFQMVVDGLEPVGTGALQLAFEQLKKRLEADGLFATERKRQLPALPQRVGIVTSSTGAALQDMLNILRRHDHLEVILAATAVQGDEAAAGISEAIQRLGTSGLVDLVIVARGGGSLEDLWAFNEESVARAIAACPVPVISGVGHEVDFTISDFVADIRATTPTQAAEIVVSKLEEQERRLLDYYNALKRDLKRHLRLARTRLEGLEGSSGLDRLPRRIKELRARLERCDRLPQALTVRVERSRSRLERARAVLARLPGRVAAGGHRRLLASRQEQMSQLIHARLGRLTSKIMANQRALLHLSPKKVLQRGYSITTLDGQSTPLKSASKIKPGQALLTTLADGEIKSLVAGAPLRKRRAAATPDQRSLFDDEGATLDTGETDNIKR